MQIETKYVCPAALFNIGKSRFQSSIFSFHTLSLFNRMALLSGVLLSIPRR